MDSKHVYECGDLSKYLKLYFINKVYAYCVEEGNLAGLVFVCGLTVLVFEYGYVCKNMYALKGMNN